MGGVAQDRRVLFLTTITLVLGWHSNAQTHVVGQDQPVDTIYVFDLLFRQGFRNTERNEVRISPVRITVNDSVGFELNAFNQGVTAKNLPIRLRLLWAGLGITKPRNSNITIRIQAALIYRWGLVREVRLPVDTLFRFDTLRHSRIALVPRVVWRDRFLAADYPMAVEYTQSLGHLEVKGVGETEYRAAFPQLVQQRYKQTR